MQACTGPQSSEEIRKELKRLVETGKRVYLFGNVDPCMNVARRLGLRPGQSVLVTDVDKIRGVVVPTLVIECATNPHRWRELREAREILKDKGFRFVDADDLFECD